MAFLWQSRPCRTHISSPARLSDEQRHVERLEIWRGLNGSSWSHGCISGCAYVSRENAAAGVATEISAEPHEETRNAKPGLTPFSNFSPQLHFVTPPSSSSHRTRVLQQHNTHPVESLVSRISFGHRCSALHRGHPLHRIGPVDAPAILAIFDACQPLNIRTLRNVIASLNGMSCSNFADSLLVTGLGNFEGAVSGAKRQV